MSATLELLHKLPAAEKLRIVEQLWDDISGDDDALLVQDWHAAEALRRAEEMRARPEIALSREELWQRVDRIGG